MNDGPRAVAPLYALLARIALWEVDRPLLEALRRGELAAGLDKAEPGCAADLRRDWSDDDVERAATEYCALYVLPDGPSPRASAWLPGERERVGAGVDDLVSRVMAALDVAPEGPLARVPHDHLGFLLHLAALALADDRADVRAVGDGLIERALRPWVPTWAERVRAAATVPLYRAHATLVSRLVAATDGERSRRDDTADRPL